MRCLLFILLTTLGLHAVDNELIIAAKALDVKKVEELIQQGALNQLEPLEIVAITQELQPFIKKHTLSTNIACAVGKLIVGVALLYPASRCVYRAFAWNEDNSGSVDRATYVLINGPQDDIFKPFCEPIKRFCGPIVRDLGRFFRGDIGVVALRIRGGGQNTFHLPLIAVSGFCLAAGGCLVASALKDAIEIPNSEKALRIMGMLKAELKRLEELNSFIG